MHDDIERDVLMGGSGSDRFYANRTGGTMLDLLSDRNLTELGEDLI